jgi:hypothetical protein
MNPMQNEETGDLRKSISPGEILSVIVEEITRLPNV